MSVVKRQKVFWDDGGETIKRFHEVDCVLASDYDRDVNALSERNDALEFQAAHNYEVSQLLLTERDELRAQVEAMRADAARFQKLLSWMASNVPEGWSEVERLGAICAYVSFDDARAYLDNLPECNVGLCSSVNP